MNQFTSTQVKALYNMNLSRFLGLGLSAKEGHLAAFEATQKMVERNESGTSGQTLH